MLLQLPPFSTTTSASPAAAADGSMKKILFSNIFLSPKIKEEKLYEKSS